MEFVGVCASIVILEVRITILAKGQLNPWEELLSMDLVYVERSTRSMARRAAFAELRRVRYRV